MAGKPVTGTPAPSPSPSPSAPHALKPAISRRRSLVGMLAVQAAVWSDEGGASTARRGGALYDRYAKSYDELNGEEALFSGAAGFPESRRRLVGKADGRVLEVAVGTGLNLGAYRADAVSEIVGIDLSKAMLAEASLRASSLSSSSSPIPMRFVEADVAALPFPDGSFDTVIDTFGLCVFPQPVTSLREMRRVLKPGGKLLLLEHCRSDSELAGVYQDITSAAVAHLGKGCVWNQDVAGLVETAGFMTKNRVPSVFGLVTAIEATPLP